MSAILNLACTNSSIRNFKVIMDMWCDRLSVHWYRCENSPEMKHISSSTVEISVNRNSVKINSLHEDERMWSLDFHLKRVPLYIILYKYNYYIMHLYRTYYCAYSCNIMQNIQYLYCNIRIVYINGTTKYAYMIRTNTPNNYVRKNMDDILYSEIAQNNFLVRM